MGYLENDQNIIRFFNIFNFFLFWYKYNFYLN